MLDTILGRRSIRKFTGEPLTEEELELLLRAGMTAPSARNARPWRFVVVDDRALLLEMRRIHPYASPLDTAPQAVVLCAQPEGDGRYDAFWQQDCGACAENMLLAANALGLGGCWMGLCPDEARCAQFAALLSLPAGVEPFCVLAFGHLAEEGQRPDRFEPAWIHMNRW